MAYLVSDFLNLVRQYGMLPSTSSTGTADSDILAVADEELRTRIAPLIVASRQEWWVASSRVSLIASCGTYKVPRRAVGGRIRELQLKRADGSVRNMKRIELEESYQLSQALTGEPELFWLKGDFVCVWPEPATASGYLQFDFLARPGRLTSTSPTGYAITAAAASTGTTATITAATADAVTASSSGYADIVRAASGFSYTAVDVHGSMHATNHTLTVTDKNLALPDDFANLLVGDYIFPSDQCFVVPLPVEMHGVFVHYVVASLKRQLGDMASADVFEKTAQRMSADALQTLEPRVDGEPRRLRGGLLWRMRKSWWTGY